MAGLTQIRTGLFPGIHITMPVAVQKTAYISLALGLAFLIIIRYNDWRKKHRKNKVTDLRIAKPGRAHGIIFGRKGNKAVFSPTNDEGHVGVFSGSGTGKTAAVGIPTLRSWSGNCFVLDISGDIEANCPDIRDKLVCEPGAEGSAVVNVFDMIDRLDNIEEKYEALAKLALLLMPPDPMIESNPSSRFFYRGGRKILTAALTAFYFSGMDFIEICDKIKANSWSRLFKEIGATGNERALVYINDFDPSRESDIVGCKDSCGDAIELFASNYNVRRIMRRPAEGEPSIIPQSIEDHSVIIKVPDEDTALYEPFLNLIVSQQLLYISGRKTSPGSKDILLFLDEFASLKIDRELILGGLRKFRKRKCRIMILTQNLADIDLMYGHDTTKALLANMPFKVLLGGLTEPESQKYFSDLIGYIKAKTYSTSSNNRTITTTEAENREYIIEPADLDRQGRETVILIHRDGMGYMLLKKNYYFR